ncbi:uncharacterized protein F5891DRAFT_353545 [Suillus fuscotomentosus]|uniref:Uncharacterized protein n=1 Tax=Suillus fuscotomentosus TaxID=1912939 RepID=A0AAD4EL68_9AGAM|nr:uncharacterized protein F5891DRAFT_353545 [Suillus fuscotomentosus]KAG1907024.1 hypothetical protein F5891DRAFT_353545 [Suillus fuscotomentosus]
MVCSSAFACPSFTIFQYGPILSSTLRSMSVWVVVSIIKNKYSIHEIGMVIAGNPYIIVRVSAVIFATTILMLLSLQGINHVTGTPQRA